ncbi:MAG: hypothetical protein FJY92_12495, partial [Candidatus Hydrogenedentes bacterium]|nr:hypothetical protein [Candidatus Hydrogenedentota bacterium]
MKRFVAVGLGVCAAMASSIVANAADSPQFRGPARDGIYADTGLLKTWPGDGPRMAWKAEGIGEGYASASDVAGTVYLTGMLEDEQGYVFALDPKTGKEKWRVAYGRETQDKQAPGARSTPTIDGDRLYVFSGLGLLTCLSTKDGKQVWQVDVRNTFNGQSVTWSFAESPLVDGDLVFATPGGPDAAVVALNKMTGETVWQSKGFSEASAYCSPSIFTFGGNKVLVTMTAKSAIGVDAKTGKALWSHLHETEYDIHAVTPAVSGNIMYYTGGYGSGGGALEVSADGSSVKPLWSDKHLDCQHHGVVLLDGYVYGTGHKNNKLVCLELKTGKLMWETDEVTQGDIAFA